MAESKNSFIQSKMNKDLDERLIPSNVYRDALNVAISRSEGSDVGALEGILGNTVVSSGSGHVDLKIIGKFVDEANSLIYFFKTNYTGTADILPVNTTSYEMSIEVYNIAISQTTTLVQGNFLNFSTQSPIYGVNLIENLLFWTDNRNAPRKINIDNILGYYTTADQISVCKWAPYLAPEFIDLRADAAYFADFIPPTYPSTMSDGSDISTVKIGSLEVSSKNLAVTRYRNGDEIPQAQSFIEWTDNNTNEIGCWCYYDNSVGNGVDYGILYNKWAVADTLHQGLAPDGYRVTTEADWDSIANAYIAGEGTKLKTEGFEYWKNVLVLDTPGTDYTSGVALSTTTSSAAGANMTVTITTVEGGITAGVITSMGNNLYVAGDTITITQAGAFGGTFEFTGSIEGTNTKAFNGRGSGERVALVDLTNDFVGLEEKTTFWTSDVNDKFVQILYNNADATLELAAADPKLAGRCVRVVQGGDFVGWNGDPEYLKDKFVKFSYRFKFNDNEYSLIAPFSQDVFIPEQQGQFVNNDENEAFITSVVEFMQNSINTAVLNITLPSIDIRTDYKIKAIDIVVKESDSQLYSVVETIPVDEDFIAELNNTNVFQYTYQSLLPIKTLTLNQTTRVFDKVPVTALAQETSGNRVLYSNYTQNYGTPYGLDYYVNNNDKSPQEFIQYPQHSLKQNRNYQVGIILADKYGRETDVILSTYDDQVDSLGNAKPGSNLFITYKPLLFANDIELWRGDNIQLNFNSGIPEGINAANTTSDYPGTYAVGNYYEVPDGVGLAGKYFWDLSNQSIIATAAQTVFDFYGLSCAAATDAANSYALYKNEGDGWILVPEGVNPGGDYILTSPCGVSPVITLNVGKEAVVGVVYKFKILYTTSSLNKYETGQYVPGGDPLIADPIDGTFATAYPTYFAVNKELRGLYCDYTTIKTVTTVQTAPVVIRAVEIFTTQEVATKYLFNNSAVTRPEPVLAPSVSQPIVFATYDINPRGFYSYRVGIKQQQQDYYNVYLPGIVNGYPLVDDTIERNEVCFTTLIADNINKIPRNLQDVGPLQNQFTSDERMWGRVTNIVQTAAPAAPTDVVYNKQFLPASSPDRADFVSTLKDAFPEAIPDGWPTTAATTGEVNPYCIYDYNTKPYGARITTQNPIGVTEDLFTVPVNIIPGTNFPYSGGVSLAVYETVPVTVPFELFYETSTSGLISDLNDEVQGANTSINGMTTPIVTFPENLSSGLAITSDIYPTINGTVFTGATAELTSVYSYNTSGGIDTSENFAAESSLRFGWGSNATGSIFIKSLTGIIDPDKYGGTFYAGSSTDGADALSAGGTFVYTIRWDYLGVTVDFTGTLELSNVSPVIVGSGNPEVLTIASEWVYGDLNTIEGSSSLVGISPSGRNGSLRNTDSTFYGHWGVFDTGDAPSPLCWTITQVDITDETGAALTPITGADIANYFEIQRVALTGTATVDADLNCRFNLRVVKETNPLAYGYCYTLTFKLVDRIGSSIFTTSSFCVPANSYTSVHSTPYTSGTGAGTQTSTELIGNGIVPGVPSWSGQLQNWTTDKIYFYIKYVVSSETDQDFIVEVTDAGGTTAKMGEYPYSGNPGATATPTLSFPATGENFEVVGGLELEAFTASSGEIANSVRPGQFHGGRNTNFPVGTCLDNYSPYDYIESALVNLKFSIAQEPYIAGVGETWTAELMWSTIAPASATLSDLNSIDPVTGTIPPWYSNETTIELVSGGSSYITAANPYPVYGGSGSCMSIEITTLAGVVTGGTIVEAGTNYELDDIINIDASPQVGTGATWKIINTPETGSQVGLTNTPIPWGPR